LNGTIQITAIILGSGVEYIRPKTVGKNNKNFPDNGDEVKNKPSLPDSNPKKKDSSNDYRYHKPKTANSAATKVADPEGTIENKVPESIATIALLTSMS
jgi:hypothetical protein